MLKQLRLFFFVLYCSAEFKGKKKSKHFQVNGTTSSLCNFSRCLLPHSFPPLKNLSTKASLALTNIHSTSAHRRGDKMAEQCWKDCVFLYVSTNQPALTCVNTQLRIGTLSLSQREKLTHIRFPNNEQVQNKSFSCCQKLKKK